MRIKIVQKWHIQKENTQRREETSAGHIIKLQHLLLENVRIAVQRFFITEYVPNVDFTEVNLQ